MSGNNSPVATTSSSGTRTRDTLTVAASPQQRDGRTSPTPRVASRNSSAHSLSSNDNAAGATTNNGGGGGSSNLNGSAIIQAANLSSSSVFSQLPGFKKTRWIFASNETGWLFVFVLSVRRYVAGIETWKGHTDWQSCRIVDWRSFGRRWRREVVFELFEKSMKKIFCSVWAIFSQTIVCVCEIHNCRSLLLSFSILDTMPKLD